LAGFSGFGSALTHAY
jgi:hypothetical protein